MAEGCSVFSRGEGSSKGQEGIFAVSRIFGIFPFSRSGKFRLSKPFLVYSITLFLIFYYFFLKRKQDFVECLVPESESNSLLACNRFMLRSCLLSLPLLSPIFLLYKLSSLEDIFAKLDGLYATTKYRPTVRTKVIYFFAAYTGVFFLTMSCKDLSFLARTFPQVQVFLVLDQFTSIVNIFRLYRIFLRENLNMHNAQQFVRYTEILWDCSSTIMECYTPQLIVFMGTAFATTITNIYIVIFYFKELSNESKYATYIVESLIYSLECYYLIYTCSETKIEAVNFDKLLHRMVIEDETRTLLRNKRITLHFKSKHKEQFSAMGFFNFDYPLFCSLVYSATTYIVIFIQFS